MRFVIDFARAMAYRILILTRNPAKGFDFTRVHLFGMEGEQTVYLGCISLEKRNHSQVNLRLCLVKQIQAFREEALEKHEPLHPLLQLAQTNNPDLALNPKPVSA